MLAFVAASASWQPPRCGVPRARPDLVLRTAPVLALLDGQKPILPTEFTQAVPDLGQARLPLSPTLPDPRAKIPGARELPPCTVVVAGANGRVGSRVVTELLRKHSKVNVRALVRSARANPNPNPNPNPYPNPDPNPYPNPNPYVTLTLTLALALALTLTLTRCALRAASRATSACRTSRAPRMGR